MTQAEFDNVIEERIEKIRNVLVIKGKEYTRGPDRLHNFKRGSQISGRNVVRTIEGYLNKHLSSFYDMIDDADKGIYPSREYLDEKIGDLINYMIITEAAFREILTEDVKNNEKNEPSSLGYGSDNVYI